jgi:hypothetical protein
MSRKAIAYDSVRQNWLFPYEDLRTEQIGRRIACALSRGEEAVQFEDLTVSVNYLVEMLRFKGRYGWFYDAIDLGVGDHEFDPNRITPSSHWQEVQELRRKKRELTAQVRVARGLHQDHSAEQLEQLVRDTQLRIRELLRPGG